MTPDDLRAALEPVFRAAVLDAFKLGVGHAIGAIDDKRQPHNGLVIPVLCPMSLLDDLSAELRAYVATMTYEDLP